MKNDGILYNQKFNISHYVDEKLKDPNLKLKFGNNEFTMAEINNIIPSKEKKIDLFIEWDNMCQYTAIGLVSLLNELIKENRSIDIKKFMERDEYPNGIDYVKNHSSEDIAKVILNYFPDVSLSDLTLIVDRYKNIDSWYDTTLITEENFNHVQEIMESAGELTKKAPYDKLVDTRFSSK